MPESHLKHSKKLDPSTITHNKFDYSKEPHGLYFMIDTKSFYASVEAVEHGMNPMKAILIVMSEADNTGSGLVLAASPMAKKKFGIKNVSRAYDVPQSPDILIVNPRMNLYIKKNLQINQIFNQFAADEDIYPYSIDESLINMTSSWKLFSNDPWKVARKIQLTIKEKMGLYTTVGIGENPVQAKLALDLLAKHDHEMIGVLNYSNFSDKIWPITDMTSVWSIGKRTEKHLNRVGINSIYDLAMSNPFELKKEFGIIGTQLYALAWGIDRTNIRVLPQTQDKSWGNSQVLPRDYQSQTEIETVILEIGDQVASRMRHHGQQTQCISLMIGFSYSAQESSEYDGTSGFSHSLKIDTTDNTKTLNKYLIELFRKYWLGQPVRNIGVSYSKLVHNNGFQLNMFVDADKQIKSAKIDGVLDSIRDRFGTTSLFKASSLKKGSTFLTRAGLVGGHNGGNSFD